MAKLRNHTRDRSGGSSAGAPPIPSGDDIVTEGGDPVVTEAADQVVTE